MSVTIDRNDPRLKEIKDDYQQESYLILSDEERSKGFIRPVRTTYIHTGVRPQYKLRDLTEEEKDNYRGYGYIKYEEYPNDEVVAGRLWTKELLNSGCGEVTQMGISIAETYARDPKFYGATFCMKCKRHIDVNEFKWDDGEVVGS